jgi:NADP-dependent 3-hydroxy acid dehydrogenase YdfG
MLNAQLAVVTGASRGIGLAVARRLSGAGARVVMIARSAPSLQAAASEIGGIAIAGDVAIGGQVAAMAAQLRELSNRDAPDILVNAAGVFSLAPLPETTPADFERHLSVNLLAPFLLIRAFLPAMLARGSGHIVTIGSIAGRQAFPSNGAYSASKFGVRGLHAVLALELKGTGVRSTLVEPAATDTSIWDTVDRGMNPNLPGRAAMLDADAVADAVMYALTRPAPVDIREIFLERT